MKTISSKFIPSAPEPPQPRLIREGDVAPRLSKPIPPKIKLQGQFDFLIFVIPCQLAYTAIGIVWILHWLGIIQ